MGYKMAETVELDMDSAEQDMVMLVSDKQHYH